jgi:hypothetical protein
MRLCLLAAAVLAAGRVAADETAPTEVTVFVKDGSRIVGIVVAEDEASLTLRLASGGEVKLVRGEIARVEAGRPRSGGPRPERVDPNDTRLMFAPTGRPLGKGDGYFSDHYVIFPGFAYGLTDNLSVGGGVSTLPSLGLDDQLFYVSTQVGWRLSPKAALSVGGMYAGGGEDDWKGAGVLYGVASWGRPDRSLSLGFALASTQEEEPQFDSRGRYLGSDTLWRSKPVLMVGGTLRMASQLSLVSESWLFPGQPLSQQPFAFALRFFGDRLSADVGFIFVGELMEQGLPIPWLSFSYHFGPSRSAAKRSAAAMPSLLPGGQTRRR